MRKLNPSSKNSFDFFEAVLGKKKVTQTDPKYKERVCAHLAIIKTVVNKYDELFEENTLERLKAHGFKGGDKDDLQKLYSYGAKAIQELKNEVTTTAENRIISTCQCCTIGEVGNFDHMVPKEEFPEFSVTPKNLFPICSKCNGYKNANWREGGKRKFLNLYTDKLPDVQYLFVKLKVTGDGLVETHFEVRNDNKVEENLFKLIESHYKGLELCRRFSENADSTIIELENSIAVGKDRLSQGDMINQVKEMNFEQMKFFGRNYWKAILQMELISDDLFLSKFYPHN